MQLKWLEDFIVLAQERSFTRAAELRHVTHPAFGRRIRALEAWAGTPLVERGGGPVTLTPAGQSFLDTAGQMVRNLTQSHEELQSLAGRQARTVTLATGRTLARTVVADWLVRLQPILQGGELCIRTRALADTVGMLERNEADFSLVYHHPTLAIRLDARQFTHLTVASDRLVPVSRATAQGQALHRFGPDATRVPYLAYAPQRPWGGWWKTTWRTTPMHPGCSAWWSATRPTPTTNTCKKAWALRGCPGPWCLPTARPSGWHSRETPAWRCGLTCVCTAPSAAWGRWPRHFGRRWRSADTPAPAVAGLRVSPCRIL